MEIQGGRWRQKSLNIEGWAQGKWKGGGGGEPDTKLKQKTANKNFPLNMSLTTKFQAHIHI